jgi:hypothetical protein
MFAPIVALELHKQLSEWYQHLQPLLKFPIESQMVLDPRKAFLRAQYFSILTVTNWTFILHILDTEQGDTLWPETLIEQGRQGLQSAISYILSLESLMFHRHLTLAVNLKGYVMTPNIKPEYDGYSYSCSY